MASLLCSNCGDGIHYHDEPNGTEYIVFPRDVWKRLIVSDIWVSRYVLDGTKDYYLAWKCQNCGAIHIFKGNSINLFKAFRPIGITDSVSTATDNFIIFSDIEWAVLTEQRIKGYEINSIDPSLPRLSCRLKNDRLIVTDKASGNCTAYNCIEPAT